MSTEKHRTNSEAGDLRSDQSVVTLLCPKCGSDAITTRWSDEFNKLWCRCYTCRYKWFHGGDEPASRLQRLRADVPRYRDLSLIEKLTDRGEVMKHVPLIVVEAMQEAADLLASQKQPK